MPRLPIKVIAFDADDTLWDCQSHFEEVEEHLYSLIGPYCEDPKHELFLTESGNMADMGYGCKAFSISIIETALRVAGNDLLDTFSRFFWFSPFRARISCCWRTSSATLTGSDGTSS